VTATTTRAPVGDVAITVLVTTYNHARYIRQAIDSALAQRLAAPFEVVISEDCSTDGTRAIVEEYAARQPERVRLLLSETNLRSNEVVARGFRSARGRYLAMLDGDDYWTADDKLQAQFDFLESRRDFTICFHNAAVVDENSKSSGRSWNPPDQPHTTGLADVLRGNFLATSSVMYRRRALPAIPSWYEPFFPVTDWPLHVLYAERGRIGYLNRTLSAYRLHDGGYFSRLTALEKLQANAAFYERMRRGLGGHLDAELRDGQLDYFLGWAYECWRRGDRPTSWRCVRWAWPGRPYPHPLSLVRVLAACVKSARPGRGSQARSTEAEA
jgi:glycosyltransferase involved in cell wall biosynthesis